MAGEFFEHRVQQNRIEIFGDLRLNSISGLMSDLYQLAVRAGYRDIVLDISSMSSLTASSMPLLAAYCRYLSQEYRVDFDIVQPRILSLRNRIRQQGLAYHIDPQSFERPKSNSSDPMVLNFRDQDTREIAVDKVVNAALRTAKLERQHVAALEWSVNEITDNVLTHSMSKVGGFLMCNRIYNRNILEFTVADCGIGVARSLGISDECEAVEKAIQEGVTRNKSTNQGNGLFGTYRLALASAGVFVLKSRRGNIFVTKEGETHVRRDALPFHGTFVVCQIDCDRLDLIERAFVFQGRSHVPTFDYLEKKHEQGADGETLVDAFDICKTFGSRKSGQEARNYIKNLISSTPGNRIVIDFEGIHVISSSFADEVFGKLFVELGPMQFMRTVHLRNTASTVEGLIDRAIALRSQTGL